MKYTVSGLSSIKINETSGTIQNISGEKIEVSDSANFTDSFILYPLNQCTFDKQLYIRAYGGFSQSAEVNVVSFFFER